MKKKKRANTVRTYRAGGRFFQIEKRKRRRLCFSVAWFLFAKVAQYQLLQQLVSVNAADQGAGIVVVGDVGGVFGNDVAHQLVDGVVALYQQRVIYRGKNFFDLGLLSNAVNFLVSSFISIPPLNCMDSTGWLYHTAKFLPCKVKKFKNSYKIVSICKKK